MDPNTGKKNMFNKLNKEQGLKLLEQEDFKRKTVSESAQRNKHKNRW